MKLGYLVGLFLGHITWHITLYNYRNHGVYPLVIYSWCTIFFVFSIATVDGPAKCCTTLDGWNPINTGMFTIYQLVNVYITMENHHFSWENSMAIVNSKLLVYQRVPTGAGFCCPIHWSHSIFVYHFGFLNQQTFHSKSGQKPYTTLQETSVQRFFSASTAKAPAGSKDVGAI